MDRMSKRGGWLRLRGLGPVAVAVVLFSASSVLSRPDAVVWSPVANQVRELEARVARLELRIHEVERMLEKAPPSSSLGPETSVKAFPLGPELGYSACDPPFVRDAFGVKLLKAGCEFHATGDRCDPLYVVDRAGIKTRRPGCEQAAPQVSCDPPYVVDGQGTRVVRRECLDVGY